MFSKLSLHIAKKLFASRNKHLNLSSEGEYYQQVKFVSDLIVLKYPGGLGESEGQKKVLDKISTAGELFPAGSFPTEISYLEVLYSCSTEGDADTVNKILSDLPPVPDSNDHDNKEMQQSW